MWLESTAHEKLAGLAKLANLSHMKFVAHVKVDSACGCTKPHPKDPQHISFWMYALFAPEKAVVKIEPL
jgi:hypothetical protein